ncbi:hypothetical protein [Gimesia sp.]|uniref:hypothetical protein n=1 Tax=Gimesia sp. TaxID=2024833 RepID=UPI003A94B9D7
MKTRREKYFLLLLLFLMQFLYFKPDAYSQNETEESFPSMSVADFFQLQPEQQRQQLHSAIKYRLQLFDNIAYSTQNVVFNPHQNLTLFPLAGPFSVPSGIEHPKQMKKEYTVRRANNSYHKLIRENWPFIQKSGSDLVLCSEFSFDEPEEVYQRISLLNEDKQAVIAPGEDWINQEDRLEYWGTGTTRTRGVFFLNDAARELERLISYPKFNQSASESINPGKIKDLKTITLTLQSDLLRQSNRRGTLTVHFDPERQFLPVAYLLERMETTEAGSRVCWFEAMLLLDAVNQQGHWFPSHFQWLQSGGLPTADSLVAAYDVKVDSIEFNTVAQDDLAFMFPAGTEVRDNIRGVTFTADGKGGVQGEIQGIPYLNLTYLRVCLRRYFSKLIIPATLAGLMFIVWIMRRHRLQTEIEQTT